MVVWDDRRLPDTGKTVTLASSVWYMFYGWIARSASLGKPLLALVAASTAPVLPTACTAAATAVMFWGDNELESSRGGGLLLSRHAACTSMCVRLPVRSKAGCAEDWLSGAGASLKESNKLRVSVSPISAFRNCCRSLLNSAYVSPCKDRTNQYKRHVSTVLAREAEPSV